MAEHEAILSGLRLALELGIHWLKARGDSQLVIDEVIDDAR